ncbi:uncharacterized protein LOC134276080 [Saccostrea cucullata]|uniref:uncharacterized protein LOC134276080 n=1 Tax=Saccostrea cuccullata TaxID=36930 RepID=UPI002ED2FA8A
MDIFQTCDNPGDGTTSGGRNSPDQAYIAVPKKRRWRPYNKVWRRDQKWTREGLTYPQKSLVSQKSDEPGKDLSETRTPPSVVSDEVTPKKKRHWTYNRVWQKDKKWIREEQTQQQAVPPPTPVHRDHPTKTPPVPVPPPTPVHRDHPTKTPPVPVPRQQEPPQFLRKYWRRNRVWRRDMVWVRKVNIALLQFSSLNMIIKFCQISNTLIKVPTSEPETRAADEVQDPILVPSSEKTASLPTTDKTLAEEQKTPTTDRALSEGQETVTAGSSSAPDLPPDDGEPSPAAETDPTPPSVEQKTITDRVGAIIKFS